MANQLYPKGKDAILSMQVNVLDTAKIKAWLMSASYAPNFATDQHLSDILGASNVNVVPNSNGAGYAAGVLLAGNTLASGVFDANDLSFPAAAGTNGNGKAVVLGYDAGGTAATTILFAYIDTATGLPVTPNGGNINVVWDNGANKIFAI